MKKVIDKGPHEPKQKTRVLKTIKGYVAPTDTGTLRTVRPHLKPVDVNVKSDKPPAKGAPNSDIKIEGSDTVKDAVNKLNWLNNQVKLANFDKNTSTIGQAVLDFYRAGVHTSANQRLDSNDGLRGTYEEMSNFLNDIGFRNQFNMNAQDAMAKITDPDYVRKLANKASVVEQKFEESGLRTKRLDPFTVAIADPEGSSKRIYVSNNPLDILTSQDINGKLNDTHINVLSSFHQDLMNDFVFYTAANLRGGSKTAVGTATYVPKSGKFQHHTDTIAHGPDKNGSEVIDNILKNKLKSKRSNIKSIADMEIFEMKAMITERLLSMESEIEKQVKGETGKGKYGIGKDFVDLI